MGMDELEERVSSNVKSVVEYDLFPPSRAV